MKRPSPGAWIAALIAIVVIGGMIEEAFAPSNESEQGGGFRIDIDGDGDERPDDTGDPSADGDARGADGDAGEAGGADGDAGGESTAADDSEADTIERRGEKIVAELAGHLPDDPEGFRETLREQRFLINVLMMSHAANQRTRWAPVAERVVGLLSVAFALLLLGPFWAYRRLEDTPAGEALSADERRRRSWWTLPWFAVAAAASMFIFDFMANAIIDLQVAQITFAAVGSLGPALTDATIHLLVYGPDPGIFELIVRYTAADELATSDPLAAFDLFSNVWRGMAAAKDSAWLSAVPGLFEAAGWGFALYGPVVAVLTMIVAARVLYRPMRNILEYPLRRVEGEAVESLGRFVWEQVKIIWREIRIGFVLVLFMLVLLALAVVAVRAVAFPVAWMGLQALVSAETVLDAGGDLPDVGLFFGGLSLVLAIGVVTVGVLAAAGIVLSKAQWVLRARAYEGRKLRSFPAFWRVLGRVLVRIAGATLLATVLALGVYLLLLELGARVVDGEHVAIWAPAVIAPLQIGLMIWLRVAQQTVDAARVDVLAVEPLADGTEKGADDAPASG